MTAATPGPMKTLPAQRTAEPFGKVNLRALPDGRIWVRTYVLMERAIEGARTGIAIDGSGTMQSAFGVQRKGAPNIVSPFVQEMSAYLARKLDASGSTTVIYWATGSSGRDIEEVGTLTAEQAEHFDFAGPKTYGSHTCLLPAVRYFADRFSAAPWGLYVFISDGRLDDLDDIKKYTTQAAQEIAAGKRHDLKLVMIGVGHKIDEAQMVGLDDLDTGTEVDLWDHKIAANMQQLAEVFTEVVDENVIVAPQGLIRDSSGSIVKDYRDTGVPALLEFILPGGTTSFTLEIGDQTVTQPLT